MFYIMFINFFFIFTDKFNFTINPRRVFILAEYYFIWNIICENINDAICKELSFLSKIRPRCLCESEGVKILLLNIKAGSWMLGVRIKRHLPGIGPFGYQK